MNGDNATTLFVGMLLGFLIGIVLAGFVGVSAENYGVTNTRRSAIRAGVGMFVVDKDGKVDFQWAGHCEKEETQ